MFRIGLGPETSGKLGTVSTLGNIFLHWYMWSNQKIHGFYFRASVVELESATNISVT